MLLDLPELVLDLVGGHLSYDDMLALRSTCKGLKKFVDRKLFTKLHLFVRTFRFRYQLFYTNDWIAHPYTLRSATLAILDSNKFRERFANLRQMTICGMATRYVTMETVNLDSLNCFRHLQQLEIQIPCLKGKLNLPELKMAAFNRCYARYDRNVLLTIDDPTELDCPKLRALKLDRHMPLLSGATDQLDYLYWCDPNINYLFDIQQNIRNVSTICFNMMRCALNFLWNFKGDNLRIPSLSEIRLEKCVNFDQLDDLDELANALEDLWRRDGHLGHVKFILNGRPIESPDKLREIASLLKAHDPADELIAIKRSNFDRIGGNTFLFLIANPTLDCVLDGVRVLELNESIELNEQLIKKLQNIDFLAFKGCKPSECQMELVARNCQSLRFLTVYHLNVTERMLEMLRQRLINLRDIQIFECKYETVRPLTKFPNLEFLSSDIGLQRDELEFLYRNSRTLEGVTVVSKNKTERIELTRKQRRQEFSIRTLIITQPKNIEKYFYFDTLDHMLDHYHANFPYQRSG